MEPFQKKNPKIKENTEPQSIQLQLRNSKNAQMKVVTGDNCNYHGKRND
jgi:hypothetical protein